MQNIKLAWTYFPEKKHQQKNSPILPCSFDANGKKMEPTILNREYIEYIAKKFVQLHYGQNC